ncbi:MAG: hypothetical protein ACTHMX_00185, partial [Thermomicrobiales bacterium]
MGDVDGGSLRRTPLYERHAAAGARIIPFAGWEMPVQYEGILAEHRRVRTQALAENNGNMEAAVDWLLKKGLSKAAKKAGRVAAEGLIGAL